MDKIRHSSVTEETEADCKASMLARQCDGFIDVHRLRLLCVYPLRRTSCFFVVGRVVKSLSSLS